MSPSIQNVEIKRKKMELVWFAFLVFAAIIAAFHVGEWLVVYMYNRALCSVSCKLMIKLIRKFGKHWLLNVIT